MSNSPRKLIFILVILVVLLGIFSLVGDSGSNKFQGSVVSVNDKSVVVHGAYDTEVAQSKSLYDKEILIDESTKIVKTSFFKPIGEGSFNIDSLPKEIKNVDLATLKRDSEIFSLGIEVRLANDFLGRFVKRAIEINYIGPKYEI